MPASAAPEISVRSMRPATRSKRDAVLAAADDLAIVDDGMRDAPEVDQALRVVADPAVGAVEHQAGEFDVLGVLGQQQMAVAAIDEARRARHAGQPDARGRVRLERHRCRAAGTAACRGRTPSAACGRSLALVVERAGLDAEIGGVDRAAHRGGRRCRRGRLPQRCAGSDRPPTAESPAAPARKPRLFNIGTGPAIDALRRRKSCQQAQSYEGGVCLE